MAVRRDDPTIRWYRRKQDPTWSAKANHRHQVLKWKVLYRRTSFHKAWA